MGISMTEQGITFLFSCGVGAFLGIVYDVFRILRIAFNPKWIIMFFQDILFCLISSLTVILLIYHTNSGDIRWFSLCGCFLCFVLYYMTVGKFIIFVSEKIINFIKYILHLIYNITIKPLKIIFKFIFKILKFVFGKIINILSKLKNLIIYKHEKKKISNLAKSGFNLANKKQ